MRCPTLSMNVVPRRMVSGLLILVLATVMACGGDSSTGPAALGTVFFKVDALSCGSGTNTVAFYIDGSVVATQSATAGVLTQGFSVSAGTHILGAKVPSNGYTWPNTTFTIAAGGSFTDLLPCS